MKRAFRLLLGVAAVACVSGRWPVTAAVSRDVNWIESQAAPSRDRCTQLAFQRGVIADEIASIDRQLGEATAKALVDAIKRRRGELVEDAARLKTEAAGCGESARGAPAPAGGTPAPPSNAPPPSPPVVKPAPPPSPPAASAAPLRAAVREDLCTLLPEDFVVGEGNEPGNNPKKARPGVPRYCEGAGSIVGAHYVAVTVYGFADAAAASAEVEGYRRRPGSNEASVSSAAGDTALESTNRKAGGDEYLLAFARGSYFVCVQGTGAKIPDAQRIARQIDAVLKTWSGR